MNLNDYNNSKESTDLKVIELWFAFYCKFNEILRKNDLFEVDFTNLVFEEFISIWDFKDFKFKILKERLLKQIIQCCVKNKRDAQNIKKFANILKKSYCNKVNITERGFKEDLKNLKIKIKNKIENLNLDLEFLKKYIGKKDIDYKKVGEEFFRKKIKFDNNITQSQKN